MCPESDVCSEVMGMVKVMCVLKQSAHVASYVAVGGGGKGAKRLVFDDAGNIVAAELTAEKADDMLRWFFLVFFFCARELFIC